MDAWLDRLFNESRDTDWCLIQTEADAANEAAIEACLAIGNGAFGMRAALEQPLLNARPATLIAGLFQTPPGEPVVPVRVAAPDWLRLRVFVDDEPVAMGNGESLAYWRALDLQRGLLLSDWRQRTKSGRIVRILKLRAASLAEHALALQVAQVWVDACSTVRLEADIQPSEGQQPHSAGPQVCVWRTEGRTAALAVASASSPAPGTFDAPAVETWRSSATPAAPVVLTRMTALVTSREAGADPRQCASTLLQRAVRQGLKRELSRHIDAWRKRWSISDIELHGDESLQRALRFGIYHLISAANPQDDHVSIGARGLTGEGYLGHVFWDTDVWLLPFYALTWPAAARALLMYRYHTLPAARAKASRLGFRGALYAWESADSGDETTPPWAVDRTGRVVPIVCGTQEQHISADIAYAVWQYWQTTRDTRFLLDAGAEILLETARFWASRARAEADDQYHIRGVMGPDEYHESVDDNAYTNGLAAWNIERGLDAAALLRTRWPARWCQLAPTLGLEAAELQTWQTIAARMAIGLDPGRGTLEQFAGFFNLEDIDLKQYTDRSAPVDVLLGGDRTRQAQVIKQADVLMLHALLPWQYDLALQRADFAYYAPRCAHGSSLSPSMHALVAARLGDTDTALGYLRQAAAIDLEADHGEAALGVHIGALGGLWQAVIFGFAGVSIDPRGLRIDPHLPLEWHRLTFRLVYRNRQLRLELCDSPPGLSVWLERGSPLVVRVRGQPHRLARTAPLVCPGEEVIR
jgi:trehalose/maltose hydrolase-like predicted phosphorylase